jgi:hypothetical protein
MNTSVRHEGDRLSGTHKPDKSMLADQLREEAGPDKEYSAAVATALVSLGFPL